MRKIKAPGSTINCYNHKCVGIFPQCSSIWRCSSVSRILGYLCFSNSDRVLSGTIGYHLVPMVTIGYYWVPFGTIDFHSVLFSIIENHLVPLDTIGYHRVPLGGIWLPLGNIGYHWTPLGTIRYHLVPFRNTQKPI